LRIGSFFYSFFFFCFSKDPANGIKIGLFGLNAAGKSTLALRMYKGCFFEHNDPLCEDVYDFKFDMDGQPLWISLFDAVDFGRADSQLRYQLVKDQVGFVYAVDLNSWGGDFSATKSDYEMFVRHICSGQNRENMDEVPVLYLATKSDSIDANFDPNDLLKILNVPASNVHVSAMKCSAKTGENVEAVLREVVQLSRGEGPLRREMYSLCRFVCLFVTWYLKDTGISKDVRKMIVEYVWASRNELEVWKRAVQGRLAKRPENKKCCVQ
jgi:GTPase SAR1 family protein